MYRIVAATLLVFCLQSLDCLQSHGAETYTAVGAQAHAQHTVCAPTTNVACRPCCHCRTSKVPDPHCALCRWLSERVSCKQPLQRTKNQFFQLWETEAAWIGGDDDLQYTEINTMLRVGVPLNAARDSILAFQPGLRTFSLNGPSIVDVPEQLYDAQLSIMWRKTFSERWQTNVWLQPKIRSDFETSEDNFFFSGGAFAKYTWIPQKLDVYFGALFLDRDDISFLPGFGLIWSPTPDWRYELLLPRPKIAKRIARCGDCQETWAYLSGQLGGGSFAVTRDTGEADKVTLRDLRLFLGMETVRPGGGGKFVEVGYVFNRGIEYKNNEEEYEFGDALMLRGGIRF